MLCSPIFLLSSSVFLCFAYEIFDKSGLDNWFNNAGLKNKRDQGDKDIANAITNNIDVMSSKYDVAQEDFGEEANHSSIDGFSIGLDFTYFISKQHELKYGVEVLGYTTELDFRNSLGTPIEENDHSTEFAAYFNYKFNNNNRFIIDPSIFNLIEYF